MENYQPFHPGLKSLSGDRDAQRDYLGVGDSAPAIVEILLTNADTIAANETTETLVIGNETSTDVIGPAL